MDDAVLREIRSRIDCIQKILPELRKTLREMQSGKLEIGTKSNPVDLVTKADLESERRILSAIRAEFPGDTILAEESGLQGEGDFVWVVDPVDGTVNYAHGLPHYAISIGIMHEGEPVAGLVDLPAFDDEYRAITGQGAFKNGMPIHVSRTEHLKSSLVVTGFPYDRERVVDALLLGVRETLLNCRGIRRTGSAAVDLCYVAEGRFDAHHEINLNPWDSCGGSVIVREAGGKITGYDGTDHSPFEKTILATNGLIHDGMLRILTPMINRLGM